LVDLGVDGNAVLILKSVLKIERVIVWIGFIWLKIGSSGGLLYPSTVIHF
jgi:hypothetical protein